MAQFKELFYVVTVNNKKIICNVVEWARFRLSDSEFVQFEQDFDNFMTWFNSEIAAGRASLQTIATSVSTQRAVIDIDIGVTFSFAEADLSNPVVTALDSWHQRRLQDPQTVAVPIERLS